MLPKVIFVGFTVGIYLNYYQTNILDGGHMTLNHVPKLSKDNPTGCCPRFNPKDWDGKTFEFKNKPFVRAYTHSFFYMPLDMNKMMTNTWAAITKAKADSKDEFILMSYDLSPWKCEHLFSVSKAVPGLENLKLTGKYIAKVFEGPYQDAPKWISHEYKEQGLSLLHHLSQVSEGIWQKLRRRPG